jgi:hypothetical protein
MEQKEIIEGNEIIAVFMGGHKRDMEHGDLIWDHANYMSPLVCKYPTELEYDKNWSWIMPVVEKIESLGKLVRIEGYVCEMTAAANEDPRLVPFKIKKHKNTKIQAVWEACIDFIRCTINQKNR